MCQDFLNLDEIKGKTNNKPDFTLFETSFRKIEV